jgi:endonuclease/exonuclease/phosphatase family metal-dependent hydrolase
MVESLSPNRPLDLPDQSLRVLTYNTHLGGRLDEVLRVVREVDPHLVTLQELRVRRSRDWERHEPKDLARQMHMTYAFKRLAWRMGWEVGVALFAAGPITDVVEIGGPGPRPTGLSARVEIGGRTISVAAVHLKAVPRPLLVGFPCIIPAHYQQVARAIKRLKEMGGPAIMAGDFNTIPGTPAHRLACRYMIDVARRMNSAGGTRRTWGLPLRIDYIFASPHFRCEQCRVLTAKGSDHQPVLATLKWQD